MYTNMATSPVPLGVRLQTALTQPLQVRCEQVMLILNECSNKDANTVFRILVESIFGVNNQQGWGIQNICRSPLSRDFDEVRHFLGPMGPLLSFAYRLAQDPYLTFEFPVAYLPPSSRAQIAEGCPGVLYLNKLQKPGPGRTATNVLLNAFEFYMFHFSYFLVSGGPQRPPILWPSGDALYPTLLEDYINAYLPLDASTPPGPPLPTSPRAIMTPSTNRVGAINLQLSGLVSPITMPRSARSPSFGTALLHREGVGPQASSPVLHNPPPSHLSVWTSQVVAQVFIEMWINQCPSPSRNRNSNTFSNQSNAMPMGTGFSEYTPLDYRPFWYMHGFDVCIPSVDHVRVVRMVVKHLHYFANSIKPSHPTPLDDLKKNLWGMCRKSLYQFLCHTFNHWPLDSSFRQVLETWLSYIQPWRYLDQNVALNRSQGDGEHERIVERKWQGFIAENLLFYTMLFQNLLTRLFKLDLSAPKNAHIMFRVTKVFSQVNLNTMIKEIEEALEDPHLMHRPLLGVPPAGSLHDPLTAKTLLAPAARTHILDMEGPNHTYAPIFSQHNISVVEHLLKVIQSASKAVQREQNPSDSTISNENKNEGWLTGAFRALWGPSHCKEDQATVEDLRKTSVHLSTAQSQLCAIFNLVIPLEFGQTIGDGCVEDRLHDHASSISANNTFLPDYMPTPNGPMLTNLGRYQLINGMRRFDLKFEGDPDLQPIMTYEIAVLVRWFYALAVFLNKKYGEKMQTLYHQQDFKGRVARVLLRPPTTVYEYVKYGSIGSPHKRVARKLPPRVSLRLLANSKVLLYVLFLYGLTHAFVGCMLKVNLMLILFGIMVIIFMAALEPFLASNSPQDI